MSTTKQEREQAREYLRERIKPGDTVYTVLKHVSRSGMYRVIDVYVMACDRRRAIPLRLSWSVAQATPGVRYDRRHEGVGVSGCGMDMGFHLVDALGWAIWGSKHRWRCRGERCPAFIHSNDYQAPRGRGVRHTGGGGAGMLRHEWL